MGAIWRRRVAARSGGPSKKTRSGLLRAGKAEEDPMSDLPKFPTDMTKYFTALKMPTLPSMPEVAALMETHKRNLAALAAANKLIFEGAQAITQRQVEVIRRQVTDVTEAAKMLAAPGDARERAMRQADLMKLAYEKSVADLREVEDLLRKSSTEALDLVHHRFIEAMDEVKAAVDKTPSEG
jgi:phasin family protein